MTLEKRIAAALAQGAITSSDLMDLIEETETAITAAGKAADEARTKALDPIASPNAGTARAAMETAAFRRDRLRTVLPRLQARHRNVVAAEHASRWEADFEEVQARRDALAEEFATTYPNLVAQLIDLFVRAEGVDKDVSRVNGSAPSGERRRLLGVELTARNLDHFAPSSPPIVEGLRLPNFQCTAETAWPLPTVPLAVQVVAGMVPMSQPGADWAEAIEARNQARREESARVAAYHKARAKEREEYEAARDRAQSAARPRR